MDINVDELKVEKKVEDGKNCFKISYPFGKETLSLTAKAFDNDEFVTDAETFRKKLKEGTLFFVRPGAEHINQRAGLSHTVPKKGGTCSFISFVNKRSVTWLRTFDKKDMSSTPFEWKNKPST